MVFFVVLEFFLSALMVYTGVDQINTGHDGAFQFAVAAFCFGCGIFCSILTARRSD